MILGKYEAQLYSILHSAVSELFEAPLALSLAPLLGQSIWAAGAPNEDSVRIAPQPLRLTPHIGHQVSEAVMLWGGREAACRARRLLLRVPPPRGLRLLLLLLRWGELRVPYLQVPPLLGRDGRRDGEILLELSHKICLLGVLPSPDDHLRPLLPLVRISGGWRLPLCAPRPQGLLGLGRCLGLLVCLFAHL